MSEMVAYQPRAELAQIQSPQDVAIHRLGEWARSADAAHQIAQTLVQTSFCPESFRNKPGEATAAILAGMEVGLQPMAALRSFDVIQGTAAARAITLRAIAQSHGHEMVLEESNETRCKMKGKRRGSSEWQPVVWTIDRAKKLGVTNKPNWRNQPQSMLLARATSELARLIASDAILGIAYSIEEIEDGAAPSSDSNVDATPAAAPATRRMSRKKAEPEPGVEVAPESPLLDPSSNLAIAMFAGMNELGITERDDRLRYASDVIGRHVNSSKEMTDDDARAVLDAITRDKAPVEPDEPDPTLDPAWGGDPA